MVVFDKDWKLKKEDIGNELFEMIGEAYHHGYHVEEDQECYYLVPNEISNDKIENNFDESE